MNVGLFGGQSLRGVRFPRADEMVRVKGRGARLGVIALEVVGVLLAVFAAGAAALFFRLESGPVSLGVFTESAEFAIDRSLPVGHSVDISSAKLEKNLSINK